jgi:hypothetical protein
MHIAGHKIMTLNLASLADDYDQSRYMSSRSQKVAGSIPNKGIGYVFNCPNPTSRTMALGST